MSMDTNLGEIILYQSENGSTTLTVHLREETVWLTQAQIQELFSRERSVITKHTHSKS